MVVGHANIFFPLSVFSLCLVYGWFLKVEKQRLTEADREGEKGKRERDMERERSVDRQKERHKTEREGKRPREERLWCLLRSFSLDFFSASFPGARVSDVGFFFFFTWGFRFSSVPLLPQERSKLPCPSRIAKSNRLRVISYVL